MSNVISPLNSEDEGASSLSDGTSVVSKNCPHCGLPPSEKLAPVQGYQPGIPWSMHLRAYDAYCQRYGPQKALIEGWCRGGFGVEELDMFIPGWREELSVLKQLQGQLLRLRQALEIAESWGEAGIKSMDAEALAEYERLKA